MFRVVVMVRWSRWCDDDSNYNNIIEYYSLVLWKYIYFHEIKIFFDTIKRITEDGKSGEKNTFILLQNIVTEKGGLIVK